MPIQTELQLQEKDVIAPAPGPAKINNTGFLLEPVGLEQTPEFNTWLTEKLTEVLRYLKLSFNLEVPAENLLFHPLHLGYPDPIGQLRTHARIWGYNYKIKNEKTGELENAINPETGQLMSYMVWQKLNPSVMPIEVTDPPLESDVDTAPNNFEPEEPVVAVVA